MMPLGMRCSAVLTPLITSVWPALWPPWKRTTPCAISVSQSTSLPLPSSPHWVPTTTTLRPFVFVIASSRKIDVSIIRGPPRNRLCRAAGGAPLRGRRRRRFGGEPLLDLELAVDDLEHHPGFVGEAPVVVLR